MRRRRKGRMSQLLKGLFIGLTLLVAIIATTNLLNNSKNKRVEAPESADNREIPAPAINVIAENNKTPDSIDSASVADNTSDSTSDTDLETPKSTAVEPAETEVKTDTYKPALEGEQTTEEIAARIKAEQEKNIQYGFLKATAVDPKNKQSLKANFTIFNDKNIKVIEGDSTNNPSFKLPVGRYRVVATLLNSKNQETKAESIEHIIIRDEEITRKIFTVSPPVSIGVLQVSAINAKNKQVMRANFTVQKENGEVVATRNNVANTLFKLESGSYKVTVKSGENTDFRTVDIDSGGSTKEVFRLQESFKQGKLLIRAFESSSDKKVNIDILITNARDEVMQKLSSVSQTEISLPLGNYTINVATDYAQANKNISIFAGKTVNEVFRFDPPVEPTKEEPVVEKKPINEEPVADGKEEKPVKEESAIKKEPIVTKESEEKPEKIDPSKQEEIASKSPSAETETANKEEVVDNGSDNNNKETVISDDVTITAVDEPKVVTPPESNNIDKITAPHPELVKEINKEFNEDPKPAQGRLRLYAKNKADLAPIKSNFYIQTLSGKHIAKTIYADNATFKLKPGTYKVTVRANNRKNVVKTIQVSSNQQVNSTFSLEKISTENTQETQKTRSVNSNPTTKSRPSNNARDGFLRVTMRPSGNIRANDKRLNTHFIILKTSGEKVVELTNVPKANFKLDVGEYKVTAINNRNPRSQTIRIRGGQVTNISFNLSDFQARRAAPPRRSAPSPQRPPRAASAPVVLKGGLRSHIVNQSGQHLKGNLSVSDNTGRIVARANNVSVGVFNLPPASYTIKLEYRGLQGSERVRITTGETTVQTFTIAQ